MVTDEDFHRMPGGGRRRLAARLFAAVAMVGLLAGVVAVAAVLPGRSAPPAAPTVATGPPPDGVPDRLVPWRGARPAGPRQLTVTVHAGGGVRGRPSDPCWEGYQPEVRSEPDRVVLSVRRFRSRAALGGGQACTAIAVAWNVAVPLPDDLGGRPLVDGADGQARPVLADLLAPLWLPRGWELASETAGDPGERWRRTYEPAPGRRPPDPAAGPKLPAAGHLQQVTVVEIEPRLLAGWNRWPDTPRLAPTDVRGVRAEVDADPRDRNLNVRWREGDRAYVVTGQVGEGADPRDAGPLVVGIARGLRKPCEPPPAVILDSLPPQYEERGGGTRPDQSRCQ